jgi:hypothetical protein
MGYFDRSKGQKSPREEEGQTFEAFFGFGSAGPTIPIEDPTSSDDDEETPKERRERLAREEQFLGGDPESLNQDFLDDTFAATEGRYSGLTPEDAAYAKSQDFKGALKTIGLSIFGTLTSGPLAGIFTGARSAAKQGKISDSLLGSLMLAGLPGRVSLASEPEADWAGISRDLVDDPFDLQAVGGFDDPFGLQAVGLDLSIGSAGGAQVDEAPTSFGREPGIGVPAVDSLAGVDLGDPGGEILHGPATLLSAESGQTETGLFDEVAEAIADAGARDAADAGGFSGAQGYSFDAGDPDDLGLGPEGAEEDTDQDDVGLFKKGGEVKRRYALGGNIEDIQVLPQEQGQQQEVVPAPQMINDPNAAPPEARADDVPLQIEEGAFILSASAIEFAGIPDTEEMIKDIIQAAIEHEVDVDPNIAPFDPQQQRPNPNEPKKVQVLAHNGEYVIPKILIKFGGKDRLEKFNARGQVEDPFDLQSVGGKGTNKFEHGGAVHPVAESAKIHKNTLLEDMERILITLESFIGPSISKEGESIVDVEVGPLPSKEENINQFNKRIRDLRQRIKDTKLSPPSTEPSIPATLLPAETETIRTRGLMEQLEGRPLPSVTPLPVPSPDPTVSSDFEEDIRDTTTNQTGERVKKIGRSIGDALKSQFRTFDIPVPSPESKVDEPITSLIEKNNPAALRLLKGDEQYAGFAGKHTDREHGVYATFNSMITGFRGNSMDLRVKIGRGDNTITKIVHLRNPYDKNNPENPKVKDLSKTIAQLANQLSPELEQSFFPDKILTADDPTILALSKAFIYNEMGDPSTGNKRSKEFLKKYKDEIKEGVRLSKYNFSGEVTNTFEKMQAALLEDF